jgi:hypothetical protein
MSYHGSIPLNNLPFAQGVPITPRTIGNVFYVDHANGNNNYDGLSRRAAVADLITAIGLCVDGNDDVIIVMDGNDYTAAETPINITLSDLHIFGVVGNPLMPESVALYRSEAADEPLIYVTGHDVEIAYMALDANWDSVTPDGAYANRLEGAPLTLDGNAGGFAGSYNHLHHLRFPGWFGTRGIQLWGSSYNHIHHSNFGLSEAYTLTDGIGWEGNANNPVFNTIAHNIFRGITYGIRVRDGLGTPHDWVIGPWNIFCRTMDYAMTSAIYMGASGNNHYGAVVRNSFCFDHDSGWIKNADGDIANAAELLADHASYAMCNHFADGLAFT